VRISERHRIERVSRAQRTIRFETLHACNRVSRERNCFFCRRVIAVAAAARAMGRKFPLLASCLGCPLKTGAIVSGVYGIVRENASYNNNNNIDDDDDDDCRVGVPSYGIQNTVRKRSPRVRDIVSIYARARAFDTHLLRDRFRGRRVYYYHLFFFFSIKSRDSKKSPVVVEKVTAPVRVQGRFDDVYIYTYTRVL